MIEFVKKAPLFSQLNQMQLQAIANICSRKSFKAGTILFQEKELGSTFYLVYSGSAQTLEESVLLEIQPLS
jgi:CRP/FNR family transcriptional regulator, cyclic AMP receptor protein